MTRRNVRENIVVENKLELNGQRGSRMEHYQTKKKIYLTVKKHHSPDS